MNCIAPGPIETEVDRDLEEKKSHSLLSFRGLLADLTPLEKLPGQ